MKKHVLHRLDFEVNAPSEMNGKQLQLDLSDLIKEKILEKIGGVFDKFDSKKELRIPKLELEINGVTSDDWEEKIISKILKQLLSKLKTWESNQIKDSQNPTIHHSKKEDSFLFFLKNGTSPWWDNTLNTNTLPDILKVKIKSVFFQEELSKLLQSNKICQDRFIFQLRDQEFFLLLETFTDHAKELKIFFQKLEKIYSKWFPTYKSKLKTRGLFFEHILGKKNKLDEIQAIILEKSFLFFSQEKTIKSQKNKLVNTLFIELESSFHKPNTDIKSPINIFFQKEGYHKTSSSITKAANQKTDKFSLEDPPQNHINNQEGYYINNAGLVILHPFFQYLFEDIGYTKRHLFVDDQQQQQAALALHYLITRNETSFETDLILNKILCNNPIVKPIDNQLILNEKLKLECDNLLKATIQHWGVLRSTSPDGLRNTFLQREGKISQKKNEDWLLQVQPTGVDILLSKLPWGIGMIKLPWMSNTLFVEWA